MYDFSARVRRRPERHDAGIEVAADDAVEEGFEIHVHHPALRGAYCVVRASSQTKAVAALREGRIESRLQSVSAACSSSPVESAASTGLSSTTSPSSFSSPLRERALSCAPLRLPLGASPLPAVGSSGCPDFWCFALQVGAHSAKAALSSGGAAFRAVYNQPASAGDGSVGQSPGLKMIGYTTVTMPPSGCGKLRLPKPRTTHEMTP